MNGSKPTSAGVMYNKKLDKLEDPIFQEYPKYFSGKLTRGEQTIWKGTFLNGIQHNGNGKNKNKK